MRLILNKGRLSSGYLPRDREPFGFTRDQLAGPILPPCLGDMTASAKRLEPGRVPRIAAPVERHYMVNLARAPLALCTAPAGRPQDREPGTAPAGARAEAGMVTAHAIPA